MARPEYKPANLNYSAIASLLEAMPNAAQNLTDNIGNIFEQRREDKKLREAQRIANEERQAKLLARQAIAGSDLLSQKAQEYGVGNAGNKGNAESGYENIINSLQGTESGGNWQARNDAMGAGNQRGHYGRLQFGHARLNDFKSATGKDFTVDEFLNNPNLQQEVENWHFRDIDNQIDKLGLGQYEGTVINGTPITRDAMRAMAHLGGVGGLNSYLKTGGKRNPGDVFGTTLSKYAQIHGNAGTNNTNVPGVSIVGNHYEIDPQTAQEFIRSALAKGADPDVISSYVDGLSSLLNDRTTRINNRTLAASRLQDVMYRPAQEERADLQSRLAQEQEARLGRSADVLNQKRLQDMQQAESDALAEAAERERQQELQTLNQRYVQDRAAYADEQIAQARLSRPEMSQEELMQVRSNAEAAFDRTDEGRALLTDMQSFGPELYETTVPGQFAKELQDVQSYRAKREGASKKSSYQPRLNPDTGELYPADESKRIDKYLTKDAMSSFINRTDGLKNLSKGDKDKLQNKMRDTMRRTKAATPESMLRLVEQAIVTSWSPFSGSSKIPGAGKTIDFDLLDDMFDEFVVIGNDAYQLLGQ